MIYSVLAVAEPVEEVFKIPKKTSPGNTKTNISIDMDLFQDLRQASRAIVKILVRAMFSL